MKVDRTSLAGKTRYFCPIWPQKGDEFFTGFVKGIISFIYWTAALCGIRWGWGVLGQRKNRREFLCEMLEIWDKTVKHHPELTNEYMIAHEWLTKTWTVEELSQFPK